MPSILNQFKETKSAKFSPDGLYRLELYRQWDARLPAAIVIGLNPSTAGRDQDDATSRVLMSNLNRLGFGAYSLFNLFAFISTTPILMMRAADPIGPKNNELLRAAIKSKNTIICVWGMNGRFMNREQWFLQRAAEANRPLHALKVSKTDQPCHPLRLRHEGALILWKKAPR